MADEQCNTDTEEGTIALQRKRSRRVSFAENTMVHIFDRDEECGTPPEPKSGSSDNPPETTPSFSGLGFHHESSDSKEYSQNEEDEYEDELDSRRSFLRPFESPSSGSIIGSTTSNDDFFGPVSASFIKPGQLSDSSRDENNLDVTMDSTCFSMHFRSIARSESEDLKTSTGILSFEEKTPTQDSGPTKRGSSMVLTVAKKPNALCTPIPKLKNSGNDSNDMSLVGDGPKKYDFGIISPVLGAILAEGSKDLPAVASADKPSVPKSPTPTYMEENLLVSKGCRNSLIDLSDDGDTEIGGITLITPKEGESVAESGESKKDAFVMSPPCLHFSPVGHGTDPNTHKEYKSSLTGWISPSNRSETLLNTVGSSKSPWVVTPSQKQSSSLLDENISVHSKSAASIQKSISRLAMLEASPFYSTPSSKIKSSTVKSLDNFFQTTPVESLSDQNSKEFQNNHVRGNDGIEMPQLPNVEENAEETLVNHGNTSGELLGTGLNYVEDNRANSTPCKISSSPEKRLETSPEYKSSLSKDLRMRVEHQQTADNLDAVMVNDKGINLLYLRDEGGTIRNSPNPANKLDSAAMGINGLPVSEIHSFEGVTEVEKTYERESNLHGIMDKSGSLWNSPITVRDKDPENLQDARFGKELPCGKVNADASALASPFASRHEVYLQRDLPEIFSGSPCTRETQNVANGDNICPLILEDGPSPNSSQLKNGPEKSSAQKRKNEEIKDGVTDHMKEKLHKGSIHASESLEHQHKSNIGTSTSCVEMKHWTDSHSKFLVDTEKIVASSVDKLNLREIDALDDILYYMQRLRAYEMLKTQLQLQMQPHDKTFDLFSNIQHKRVTDTKSALHKVLHERIKLKLMQLKRERLLEKVQLVHSDIQESQLLKSKYLPQRSVSTENNNGYQQSAEDIQEVAHHKSALKQTLETLEARIRSLTKVFHNSCKMKGDQSRTDTIISVNDHLRKRTRGQFIRVDSQLWVIDSLESRNGHHNYVLNYHDFNTQRLSISADPVPCISISNMLNYTKIAKSLPGMDVCTAFSFVLHGKAKLKYFGARSLLQETQTSNLVLGNLLDVAEEVLQARVELQNLTQTRFHSQSVEQLDLQLCFFDFRNSRKMVLTLDMSCLKRGIYPLDTIPCFPAVGSHNSFSEQLVGEINSAVQNLRAGYFRIISLCRCISQAVQAFSTR